MFCFIEFINAQKNIQQTQTENYKVVFEYEILNKNLLSVLDTIILQYGLCPNVSKDVSWYINISDVKNENKFDIKKFIFSINYDKDKISRLAYGYFYYKGYLFTLNNKNANDVFRKTPKHKVFQIDLNGICIFDPARWLYGYYNGIFYYSDSVNCGG
jgi:hypothetical protein